MEGVAGLEVALSRFGEAPEPHHLGAQLLQRTAVQSLSAQIRHLGLSGSLRYLVPLIFGSDELPMNVLTNCWAAIQARQAVVHEGQRDVSENQARRYLDAVRTASRLLENHTARHDTI
jgi:hypothetical protein